MKKITRKEASQLLHKFRVIDTKIQRIQDSLLVQSILSNNRAVVVKYDVKKHRKSYFINN